MHALAGGGAALAAGECVPGALVRDALGYPLEFVRGQQADVVVRLAEDDFRQVGLREHLQAAGVGDRGGGLLACGALGWRRCGRCAGS